MRLEAPESLGEIGVVAHDVGEGRAVLAAQLDEQLAALTNRLTPLGIVDDRFAETADIGAEGGEFLLQHLEPGPDLVEGGGVAERLSGSGEGVGGGAVSAEQLFGAGGCDLIVERRGEPVLFDAEPVVLVGVFDGCGVGSSSW